MKLIIGLGNPGKGYEGTRHNAGFMVVEALALKLQAASYKPQVKFGAEVARVGDIFFVKPQTYMNRSGEAVRKVMDFYKLHSPHFTPENLFVVHDDLDIRLGEYKIGFGVGPKVHNGVNSVRDVVGNEFWYVRIGVNNRDQLPETKNMPGEAYVLNTFEIGERPIINDVIQEVVDELISRHL